MSQKSNAKLTEPCCKPKSTTSKTSEDVLILAALEALKAQSKALLVCAVGVALVFIAMIAGGVSLHYVSINALLDADIDKKLETSYAIVASGNSTAHD